MAFNIVVGGVVRHIAYCTIPGQVSVMKRDWQCTSISGGSTIDSAGVISDLDTMMSARLIDLMSEDATYYGSQLYYQTPVGLPPRPDYTRANTGIGIDNSPLLPTQTCGLVSLYSDVLGKTGQGRVYCPFPAIIEQDTNGTPKAAYITTLNNLGAALTTTRAIVSGGVTAQFTPVLYIPGGLPPKPLIKYVSRDAWATQRRRGSFGRLNNNPF